MTEHTTSAHTGMDAVTARTIPVGATITRVYWAVPTHYSTGEEFATEAEAIAAGIAATEATIERHRAARAERGEQSFVPERFYVDLRWTLSYPAGGGTDVVASRTNYQTLGQARAHLERIERFSTR